MKVDAKYHEVNNLYSLAERLQVSLIYPPIEAKLFKTSNKITAVSKAVAEELRKMAKPTKHHSYWKWCSREYFLSTRGKLNTENYVLYTGILREKGLFDLVDCANIVRRARPNIKFVVCGRGALLNDLLKKTKRMGLQANFHF